MPTTWTPARKKEVAAAEITALAAGAGPPANRIPTRSNKISGRAGYDKLLLNGQLLRRKVSTTAEFYELLPSFKS